VRKSFANIFFCKDIGFFSKLNCYWFFCRYFVFALVTLVALLAPPIILWLDPWVWGFPTIFFLVRPGGEGVPARGPFTGARAAGCRPVARVLPSLPLAVGGRGRRLSRAAPSRPRPARS
jgi:hypothetical protein